MEQARVEVNVAAFPPEGVDQLCLQMIEAIGAAVMLHRGGRILSVNRALEELSGYTRAELLAMDFLDLATDQTRERVRKGHGENLAGDAASSRYESQIKTKSGAVCAVEVHLSRIVLEGLPTVVVSLRDLTERKRADSLQRQMRRTLNQIIDGNPVPTLVIDAEHKVTHWNKACAEITGVPAQELIGTNEQWRPFYAEERPIMADLVANGAIESGFDTLYEGRFKRSAVASGAFEAEGFFPHFGESGRWLFFTAAPLLDDDGHIIGAIETLQDVTERRVAEEELRNAQAGLEELVERRTQQLSTINQELAGDIAKREAAERELMRRNAELTALNTQLSDAKQQLVQSEKLASIGQLAAGVAHEINNPIGYVHSNIGSLEKYLEDVFEMLVAYETAEAAIGDPQTAAQIKSMRELLDIEFLREDIPQLMQESKEGITRVKKIVQDLKDFSHVDTTDTFQMANLHQGIDSTLNIVANEIKYKADVVKEYGELPEIECLPTQINQVIMNICVNAAHAMSDTERGKITIRTGCAGNNVWIEIADTGSGIPAEILAKIFDPFFTTKPIGKGTGLGLSLSYGIVQNHNGRLAVKSEVGKGTTFRITLPVKHVEGAPVLQENSESVEEDWSL
ncbi:PAS domain S-box protein [Propionivibrio sp.]|uniref:PAS domain S-box protein n=1 Tax=Propionivibrio sp. TaxID=2212460 RepID=UPI0025ED6F2E|nr:PAS domain S-box protein [Propionivibrio sp.]MBK8401811.1 PAS domain S-box protein [Propionivibrio sp.]MBK8744535.1 PAS domain S-box protein [Propionivibrio sp.]MBK8894959.1 PAS domain S-box protein [Propionivibrio sp.]MBL0208277.1 PAS domain S-box protein [Propionivibrio sp.]